MVTRAEVAAMAGVSPAVVSYVVNGGPRPVSREARERVEAAIEVLGYRPNAIAAALRGGSTKSIGLIIPSPTNPYFAELADAIERESFEADNLLTIGISDDDLARERGQLRSMLDRRVDGIILVSHRALATMTESRMGALPPIVVVDRVETDAGVSAVYVENRLDTAYAVEHLQSWGHRVIGCIAGPRLVPLSMERIEGWRDQQAVIGAPADSELLAHGKFSAQGGYEAARMLLGGHRSTARREVRPTALFISSDVQAQGALLACEEQGIRVPEDLSIVSFDGTQAARFTRPTLTTMRQPIRALGSTATRLVLSMASDEVTVPTTTVFRSNLVLGRSCAAPRLV